MEELKQKRLTEEYFKNTKNFNGFGKVFWWLSGADLKILKHSPYSDRVKYFGLGGVVLTTGILAALSGGYAFFTIFSSVDFTQNAESLFSNAVIKEGFFGLIWGLVILNLDRFIIGGSNIGDGTGRITKKVLWQASPRIFLALVLSFVIAAPLELRIFEKEINAELFRVQSKRLIELNQITDQIYQGRVNDLKDKKISLTQEIGSLENLIEQQEIKYQEEIAGRVSGVPGAGIAAKSIRDYLDNSLKPKLKEVKTTNNELIADLDLKIEALDANVQEGYAINEQQVKLMGGFLQRLQIAHKVAGWKVVWLIRLVFILIETAPILFKMMMKNEVYEDLHQNLKEHIRIQEGVVAQSSLPSAVIGSSILSNTESQSNQQEIWQEANEELTRYAAHKWIENEKSKIDEDLNGFLKTKGSFG